MSNDLWTLKIEIQKLNAMHFTRANSCRSLLRSILDRSLISMANYYLTLKFKIRWLKSSIFIEYVRLPEYQNKNPQSTGEILFLLFKTRLHRKLLPKYVIVLQVAAKNASFITLYTLNFSLVQGNILLVTHSQKRHRLVASCQFYHMLQLVNKLQQACQFHQVATYLLRSGLLQFVICRLVTTCWNNLQQACWNNQLATSPLTTFKRLVVTSCRKPCERILISACSSKLLQDVNRFVTNCVFLVV